jgi:hypothetical protein
MQLPVAEHGPSERGRRVNRETWNRQGDPTYLGDLHDQIAHMRLYLQSIASADPQTEQAQWMVETARKGLTSPDREGEGHG